MKELKNEFSWSKSRDETFRECARKYFFQYYGYWNGWRDDANPRAREIYILKRLQTRQMWVGDHVHRTLKQVLHALKAGQPGPAEDAAVASMLDAMRADFKASRSKLYRSNPKAKSCAFFEHEYDQAVPDADWKAAAEKAEQSVRAFMKSDMLQALRALPAADWLEIEEFSGFPLDGLRILVQLDAAYRKDGVIHVIDWKTGRRADEANELQLACYALYAMHQWKVEPAQVSCTLFYLPSCESTQWTPSPERLESVKEHAHESADEMLFPLTDPQNNVADDEDVFEMTEDERACRRCNFLRVCPKFG
jgi:integrase